MGCCFYHILWCRIDLLLTYVKKRLFHNKGLPQQQQQPNQAYQGWLADEKGSDYHIYASIDYQVSTPSYFSTASFAFVGYFYLACFVTKSARLAEAFFPFFSPVVTESSIFCSSIWSPFESLIWSLS